MNRGTVYLVGPIRGLSYEEATGWRNQAKKELEDCGFTVLNPMSGKENLKGTEDIGVNLKTGDEAKNQYIYFSDIHRVNESNIILANMLPKSYRPPIGSMFEIGYAVAKDKTVILVTDDLYLQKHPFIEYTCIVVPTLEDAYTLINKIGA